MTYIDGITILADAVVEPVSLTDAKNWLRITNYDTDDELISSLVNGARVHIEKLKEFPNWDGLNYHQYKKVVI